MIRVNSCLHLFVIVFCVLAFAKADAQGIDLFRVEHTYFPQSKSDNNFKRFKAFVNAHATRGVVEDISMTVAMFGPGYQHNFTKNISAYIYTGYIFINDIRLRHYSGGDVVTLNDSNTFYSRIGLKFKI